MTFEKIIQDLKNKKYYPVYLLAGEESYFIDEISNYIEENVLDETERDFNQTILYGKDTDVATIIGTAKRFPMMAEHQVVIVKEAQELRNLEPLNDYALKPQESTILVLCYKYKKFDKRKSLSKTVTKSGVFFESAKLYENKIPDWINSQLHSRGYTIRPKAAMMLTEFLGTDLSKIVNEIGKLEINLPKGSEINDQIIEENIGISKDYNVFELQKALGEKKEFKAYQIINYFAANEKDNPMIKMVGVLNNFFTKLLIYHAQKDKSRASVASALGINPFFFNDYQIAAKNYSFGKLTEVISLLREYDLKSKGVENNSSSDGELMKELVFRILN